MVWPREAKAQQNSTQSGELKSAVKEEVKERDIMTSMEWDRVGRSGVKLLRNRGD